MPPGDIAQTKVSLRGGEDWEVSQLGGQCGQTYGG